MFRSKAYSNEGEMKEEEASSADGAAVSFDFQESREEDHQQRYQHRETVETACTCRLEEGSDQLTVSPTISAGGIISAPDKHDCGGTQPPTSTNNRILCGLKWTVIGILVIAGSVVATTAFVYSRGHERTRFEEHFEDDAARFVAAFYQRQTNKIWVLMSTAGSVLARENYNENENWPYVTVPAFEHQALGHLQTSISDSIFWAPLLYGPSQSDTWESYAVENQELAELTPGSSAAIHNRTIENGIFQIDYGNDTFVDSPGGPIAAPVWQVSPAEAKRHLNMFNLFSVETLVTPLSFIMAARIPQISDILDDKTTSFLLGKQERFRPRSLFIAPVMSETKSITVTGIVGVEVDWLTYFDNVLSEGPVTTIVLRSNCKQVHTYEVRGGVASYLGKGDLHSEKYDYLAKSATFAGFRDYWFDHLMKETSKGGLPVTVFPDQDDAIAQMTNETFLGEIGVCLYKIDIYPTDEYHDTFITLIPITYTLITVTVFVCVVLVFYLYDILVERRQRRIMASAAKSDAMINSLFPAVIRDRLFRTNSQQSGGSGRPTRRQSYSCRAGIKTTDLSSLDDHGMVPSQTPKHRLTTFLKSSYPADGAFQLAGIDDDPIAEMFTNTTVMFADIAGFTAWSSEREPSQVFKLLETIYSAFDTIARRLNVFKVETIGDCYVAVTGLPIPQKEHAVLCAQFAYQCLLAMEQLTQQLDLTLGPGTSDLGLRIGLHSGPVTAGVLRGEKSRFQLFGDTVNTASRMESTGVPGKIQASQETAELIRRVGKHSWLSLRKDTVTAKGKGELQTHWVYLGQKHEETPSAVLREEASRKPSSSEQELPRTTKRYNTLEPQASFRLSNANFDENTSSKFSGRCDRLVDWNVEVLMGFLEKLVQRRLETSPHQSRGCKMPASHGSGLIIDEVVPVIELPDFAAASRTKRSNRIVKMLPHQVRVQLREFVSCIASMYRDVPFHNFEHASHVTMSANKLMKRIITPDDHVDGSRKPLNSLELHSSTFGISSDPLVQFAVVFAALIHDVDHTGLSNATLVENEFAVAHILGNKSVAEQNSVVVAWELLMESRFEELQACIFNNDHGRNRFRQLVVNAVMATDIMDRDMLQLRKNRWEKAFAHSSSEALGPERKQDSNRKATIVIEHIIQASDVAHTFQHWHIFLKHNTRLYNELYRSFKLGYLSNDPTDGWYEGEIGFFDHYVIPLAKKLKECGVFGVSGDEYLQYAEWNRKEWERKGRTELEKMILQREEMLGPE